MVIVVVVMSIVLLHIFACDGSGGAAAVSHDLGFVISCQFRGQQGRSEADGARRATTTAEETEARVLWVIGALRVNGEGFWRERREREERVK